ncbi:MAG TPA: M3 family metallopeptidase [Micromonosporaceae bacterium]|jgi:thimet oligopeptidase|nr:M3 family metallopeptidase [Micromonosporaceae bacterium]
MLQDSPRTDALATAADLDATDQPGAPSGAADLAAATADDVAGATEAAIANARERIAALVARAGASASGDDAVALLDLFDEATADLGNVGALAGLIAKCHPDAAMRDAADAAEQEISKVITDLSLDPEIYQALAALDVTSTDAGTRHYVDKTLRDFRRAGVDRDDTTRARIRTLQEELVTVGQAFDRNIRADTKVAALEPAALDGLPADYVRAHPVDDDGLVRISTDYPDYMPFMMYARDAAAREQMWRLFRQRAYPANTDVLRSLVERRHELASLLGYPSWAQYVTEDKMIGSATAAGDFIARITDASQVRAARDYDALLARKRADDPTADAVLPWDTSYLDDRLKAEKLAFDTQAVRPYFEYGRVKAGLMGLVERMFGVEFRRRTDLPVWHPDVEAYDVVAAGTNGDDANLAGERLLGRIFLDMHPRADKYSHAAMFSMVTGKAGRRVPECALLCNLPRPDADPALLAHADVVTFFHEFGHLIHHIVGGHQRWHGTSGIATEWDFVEAPSQLLEEWTFDAGTLAPFAVHYETGEPLPADTVAKLRTAAEFGKGLFVRQQMFYASLSLELYRHDPATIDLVALEREAMESHTPFKHVDDTFMHLSFGHLDGYSAIYYTYMWSLVIAKDLFTRFASEGLPAPAASHAYRDAVLASGGRAPAADIVREFLGRDYTFDAYRDWLDS